MRLLCRFPHACPACIIPSTVGSFLAGWLLLVCGEQAAVAVAAAAAATAATDPATAAAVTKTLSLPLHTAPALSQVDQPFAKSSTCTPVGALVIQPIHMFELQATSSVSGAHSNGRVACTATALICVCSALTPICLISFIGGLWHGFWPTL